jgi:hypothetical protein
VSSDLSKCFLREFRAPTATRRRCKVASELLIP